MKRVMILTMVVAMVMLMGIPGSKALAGSWGTVLGNSRCGFNSFNYGLGGLRSYGGYGRGGWSSILGNYGGYGYYGDNSTFGKIIVGGRTLSQILTTNRLVNHKISVDNQILDIARKRHEQHRIIIPQNNTVLVTTVPIRRIIKMKPKKTQVQKNENQELRQKIKLLELELEKLKLQLQNQSD